MKVGRALVTIALAIVLVAGGFLGYRALSGEKETDSYSQVVTVKRGDLQASISPTGEVYVPQEEQLFFDVTKIPLIELNVAPGHTVKAGDVLARIDTSSLERAVTQAEANLTVAQNDLESALTPYTKLDLARARLEVEQAEVALEEAKQNLEEMRDPATELDLTQARLTVDQANTNLEEARESLATVRAGPTEAQLASAEAALATAQENYEELLAGPNPEDVQRAKLALDRARNSRWSTQMSRDSTCGGRQASSASCDSANVQVLNSEISVQLAEMSYQEAQTPATAAAIANAAAQVQRAKEDLEELRNSPDALDLAQAESQVTQAEYNLASAQESLAELEAGADPLDLARAETQVTQAEYELAKSQDDLAEMEAGSDPDDVEVAQARLVSDQADLEEAQEALEAATMVAPFDGTVAYVGAKVGDLVWSNTVIVELSHLSELEILAMVDETDISNVEVGQQVLITFDALPGQKFSGKVLSVPVQGTLSQNVVTYEVPVSLEGAEDAPLKPKMTANLKIILGKRENVLLVPAMALQYGEGLVTVLVQDDPDAPPVMADVEVGLSDGTFTEIVRGLNEGDQVAIVFAAVEESQFGFGGMRQMMPGGVKPPQKK